MFGIVTLSYFSTATINRDEFLTAIGQYFICEAAGSGTECDRSEFEQYTYSGLIITTFVLLAFIPYVSLIFVVNWRATKELCKKTWKSLRQNSSNSSSLKAKGRAVNGANEISNGTDQAVSTSMAQSELSEV